MGQIYIYGADLYIGHRYINMGQIYKDEDFCMMGVA